MRKPLIGCRTVGCSWIGSVPRRHPTPTWYLGFNLQDTSQIPALFDVDLRLQESNETRFVAATDIRVVIKRHPNGFVSPPHLDPPAATAAPDRIAMAASKASRVGEEYVASLLGALPQNNR